jgi:hypothetical protein
VHPCTVTCPASCSGGLGCCHMSHGSGPRLLAREGSGTATCHTALDPASLHGRAPVLPCVITSDSPPCSGGLQFCHVPHGPGPCLPPRLRTPPPCSGGLQFCHVPHGSGPCLPAREGSSAVTRSVTLRGPRALRIKKGLAGLPMQQDSRVFKTRSHVTEASTRRAGKQRYHDLQTVRTGATAPCYTAPPHS